MRRWAGVAAFLLYMGAASTPAFAQITAGTSLSLEAASDERRRGLSWTNGDPVLRAALSVPLTSELSLDATAVTLRGSARHGGADAVIDLQAGYARQIGAWSLSAQAAYHAFPGASGQGFAEVGAGAGFMIGPASLDAFVRYAPGQHSIGGDNLYLGASLATGIPGTPLTLSGHVGHSSGSMDDPIAARRLRPDGGYWDHGVALDYRKGRWFAGLRYANSSAGDSAAHAGPTAVAHVGIGF